MVVKCTGPWAQTNGKVVLKGTLFKKRRSIAYCTMVCKSFSETDASMVHQSTELEASRSIRAEGILQNTLRLGYELLNTHKYPVGLTTKAGTP